MEIYNPPGDSIAEASHRTVDRFCAKLSGVDEGARVLDIGSGYGGTGRHLAEVGRVLRAGGDFIFTDLMQADDCPEGVLQPILERLLLEDILVRHASGRPPGRIARLMDRQPAVDGQGTWIVTT